MGRKSQAATKSAARVQESPITNTQSHTKSFPKRSAQSHTQEVSGSESERQGDEPEQSTQKPGSKMKASKSTKKDAKSQNRGMGTAVAKRTRNDSSDVSEAGGDENETTIFATPEERQRAASLDLGDVTSAQEHQDTSVTTAASSVFDVSESASPTPDPVSTPAANQGKKRKRDAVTSSADEATGKSKKRAKATTPATSEDQDDMQTSHRLSSSKKTYSSRKRTHLASQESSESRRHSQDQRIADVDDDVSETSEESDVDAAPRALNRKRRSETFDADVDIRCSLCGKACRSPGYLLRHERTHKSERKKKNSARGAFSNEEKDKLENFRKRTCEEWGLTVFEFNRLINWPKNDEKNWPNNEVSKSEILQAFYDVLPHRDTRSMRRYKDRWFRNTSTTPHKWTTEQDNELALLIREHGQKWVVVADMLGRTPDEVAQHYHNKVQHRDAQEQGPWTEEEIQALRDAVSKWKTDNHLLLGPETDKQISWSAVSNTLGNRRSRQQCSLRWRRDRRKSDSVRKLGGLKEFRRSEQRSSVASDIRPWLTGSGTTRTPSSSARVVVPGSTSTFGSRGQQGMSDKKAKKSRQPKSAERVVESEDEDELEGADEDDTAIRARASSDVEMVDQASAEPEGGEGQGSGIGRKDAEPNEEEEDDIDQQENRPMSREGVTVPVESTQESSRVDESSPELQARSRNPFSMAKTPLKTLSQLFGATQGNTSVVKTGKKREVVEDTPINPPPRPSPSIAARPEPETPAILKRIEEMPNAEEKDGADRSSATPGDSDGEEESEDEDTAKLGEKAQLTPKVDADSDEEASDDNEPPPTFSSRAFQADSSDEDEDEDEDQGEDEGEDNNEKEKKGDDSAAHEAKSDHDLDEGRVGFDIYQDDGNDESDEENLQPIVKVDNEADEEEKENDTTKIDHDLGGSVSNDEDATSTSSSSSDEEDSDGDNDDEPVYTPKQSTKSPALSKAELKKSQSPGPTVSSSSNQDDSKDNTKDTPEEESSEESSEEMTSESESDSDSEETSDSESEKEAEPTAVTRQQRPFSSQQSTTKSSQQQQQQQADDWFASVGALAKKVKSRMQQSHSQRGSRVGSPLRGE